MLDVAALAGTVLEGECSAVMGGWPDACIDLVVTSPPYDNLRDYKGYSFDFESVAQQLWRVVKPGGVVVWVVGDATINGSETGTSFRQALRFMEIGFRLHDTMIYQTSKPPMNDRRYQACFEYMFVLSNGAPASFNPILVNAAKAGCYNGHGKHYSRTGKIKPANKPGKVANLRIADNVWKLYSGHTSVNYKHPAMFPDELANMHIASWSNPGDLVLDCFAGSGTTLAAAERLNRRWIGIDISPEYCEIARMRTAQQGLDLV